MPTSELVNAPEPIAYLLAIVEVDKNDRIQCQAPGCGHSVYKRIHVVLCGLEFKVLGSQCYEYLYGNPLSAAGMPQYGSRTGKLLTPEERLVLLENTARFIETLEAERLELERVAALAAIKRQQEESVRAAKELRSQTHQALHQFQHPQHIADEARSSLYEGPEMLRWRWKSTEERVASITEYKANPAGGPHHACVVRCLKAEVQPTPYLFALDVELSQRLPKRYIFRVLDDLNLIQRI